MCIDKRVQGELLRYLDNLNETSALHVLKCLSHLRAYCVINEHLLTYLRKKYFSSSSNTEKTNHEFISSQIVDVFEDLIVKQANNFIDRCTLKILLRNLMQLERKLESDSEKLFTGERPSELTGDLLDELSQEFENLAKEKSTEQTDLKEIVCMFFDQFVELEKRELGAKITELEERTRASTSGKVDHVVVIGPTKHGKSTVISRLIGLDLKVSSVDSADRTAEILSSQSSSSSGCIKNCPVIGNDSTISQTSTITPYLDDESTVIYYDFPGFLDSRGSLENLNRDLLFEYFCEKVKHFKILLVIDYNSLTVSAGVICEQLVKSLNRMCSPDKIKDSVALLVTKLDFNSSRYTEEIATFKKKIKEKFIKNSEKSGYFAMLSNILDTDRLAFFPLIKQECENSYLNENSFINLKSSISASKSNTIAFQLNIEDNIFRQFTEIREQLIENGQQIMQSIANKKKVSMKTLIQQDTFLKEDLNAKIRPYSHIKENELNDKYAFLNELRRVNQIDLRQNKARIQDIRLPRSYNQ